MNSSTNPAMERALHHLKPQTAFDGRYAAPKSLEDRLKYYHTPGVGIAVINDFRIEWSRGFGICEVGESDQVSASTLFQASSISKAVTAMAIMRLVKEGLLDLDEDINTYLKSWRVPRSGGWQPRITLRHLMSHTAGLTVHSFPGYQRSEPLPTPRQILEGNPPACTDKIEVNILPGLHCRYSSGGTMVAQQVLVDMTGLPFPEIMHTLVLNPLDMTNSTFRQPLPDDWAPRAATAHPWKGIPLRGRYHIYPEMAAAGLWTTATDLARIGVEMLKVLNGSSPRLLPKNAVEAMLSPQLPRRGLDAGEYIGLEFFCKRIGDTFYFGCPGWNEGFMAIMRFYRHLGKGIVIMLNSNEGFPLFDEILRAFADVYEWPDGLPQTKTPVEWGDIEAFTGTYRTECGIGFHILNRNGVAELKLTHQPPLSLVAISDTEFHADAVNTTLIFKKEGNCVTEMTVMQSGQMMTAVRDG